MSVPPGPTAAGGVLLALLATVLLACSLSARQGHLATGVLLVDPGPDPGVAAYARAEVATERYAELARSRTIAMAVIDELRLDERPEDLLGRVSTAASVDDLTVWIGVRGDDAEAARAVALAYGDAMIELVGAARLPGAETAGERAGTVQATIERRMARRIRELFEKAAEPEDEPPVELYRLVWLEKPAAPEEADE